jgi:hypothetical protein
VLLLVQFLALTRVLNQVLNGHVEIILASISNHVLPTFRMLILEEIELPSIADESVSSNFQEKIEHVL